LVPAESSGVAAAGGRRASPAEILVVITVSPVIFALSSNGIDQAIFHVANALEVPVLILALGALALVIYELGSYVVELASRRKRRFATLQAGAEQARSALLAGDRSAAEAAVRGIPRSAAMAATLNFILEQAGTPGSEHQINKALADFDFDSQRRLARTRLLVRAGPALGLMGTLIPLSPALTGLAAGNTAQLSHDLRVAFSVTVVGLLIGAVAFAISLSRDRLYNQDLSDLQYVAAVVSDPALVGVPAGSVPVVAPPVVTAPPSAADSTTRIQPPS
jgi:biopolymer transport protein ExbB/TolQ